MSLGDCQNWPECGHKSIGSYDANSDGARNAVASNLPKSALALYEAPFRYERGYIFDSKNEMFADDDNKNIALRLRGFARISYMKNANTLQDDIGCHIAQALTEYWERNKLLSKPPHSYCRRPQTAMPDGWKLVPFIPTKEMLEAGRIHDGLYTAELVWNDMFNAAPSPQGKEREEA